MRRTVAGSPDRRPVAALLALLAAGLLAPSPARAVCGPYVLWTHGISIDGDGGNLGLEGLAEVGALPSEAGGPGSPAPGPRGPCTGAFCSGSPAVPVLPEPPIPPPADPWGLIVLPPPASPPPSFDRPDPRAAVRASHLGADVFHPPRLTPA